jgi:hypothetical protein
VATYLYGLILARNADRIAWPIPVAGIDGCVVRVARCGEIGALASTVERAPGRGSLEGVRAHDATLRVVVRQGVTAAASRFGQVFDDDEDMCRKLADRADRLTSMLEMADGCVEMRVLLPHAAEDPASAIAVPSGAGPGRAYLERLRGPSREGLQHLALRNVLGQVVRDERVEMMAGKPVVVLSHLVRREDEIEYRAAVAELPALSDARVVGPLPLYAFAEPVDG